MPGCCGGVRLVRDFIGYRRRQEAIDDVLARRLRRHGSGGLSPDGRSLVFRRNVAVGVSAIYWLSLKQETVTVVEPQRLTPATRSAGYPALMPNGKEILFSDSRSLWRLAVSGDRPGESVPARLPFVGEDGFMPVISPAQGGRPQRLAYVRSLNDYNIWRVETTPGSGSLSTPAVFVASTRGDVHPQISPDGLRLAYASNRSGDWEIWVSDSDGSNAAQLTSLGAAQTAQPSWSPDGQQIAFHSNAEGLSRSMRSRQRAASPRDSLSIH